MTARRGDNYPELTRGPWEVPPARGQQRPGDWRNGMWPGPGPSWLRSGQCCCRSLGCPQVATGLRTEHGGSGDRAEGLRLCTKGAGSEPTQSFLADHKLPRNKN